MFIYMDYKYKYTKNKVKSLELKSSNKNIKRGGNNNSKFDEIVNFIKKSTKEEIKKKY